MCECKHLDVSTPSGVPVYGVEPIENVSTEQSMSDGSHMVDDDQAYSLVLALQACYDVQKLRNRQLPFLVICLMVRGSDAFSGTSGHPGVTLLDPTKESPGVENLFTCHSWPTGL